MSKSFAVEALESRTLMSVSVKSVFDPAVLIDRLHVQVDLAKFRLDCAVGENKLMIDTKAIRADDVKDATTVLPLIQTFRMDVKQMQLTLKADRLTEAQNVVADELKVLAVRKQMLADKGNENAETADKAALLADRIQMQNDMIAGLDSRLQTREDAFQKISDDGQAILAAVQADPNASVKLQVAAQKWMTDKTACMTKMELDIQKLIGDRTQLVNDLTVSQSQT